MVHIIRIAEAAPAHLPAADARLAPAEPERWRSEQPDLHCIAVDRERVVARCSLWWSAVPSLPGEKLGAIGHFASCDDSAARPLLETALTQLQQAGCTLAVGPMDGNTWRRYRFITERGSEPSFFLEPDNPDDWPGYFIARGFAPLAEYTSTLNSDLARLDERIEPARKRLLNNGVTIRDFRAADFEAELRRIYDVSAVSFHGNFLYTPQPAELFIGQYLRLRERVRPELIMLAEHEGRPVGYVFGTPDWQQLARGQTPDTAIVKTVAVLPGKTYGGLGNVLVHDCQQRARQLGFTRAIHALMHSANNSRNLSGHYAQAMRRYTLFSRRL